MQERLPDYSRSTTAGNRQRNWLKTVHFLVNDKGKHLYAGTITKTTRPGRLRFPPSL